MRKIVAQMMVTADGMFAGPQGEIDWHNVDGKSDDYSADLLESVDALIFGRLTYQLMASYWPSPDVVRSDPVIAGMMNALPKFVFSKSLGQAEWNNTRLVKELVPEEIVTLKHQPGKDLAILGSSDLCRAFIAHGLIDEIRIIVNPVILGRGKSFLEGIGERVALKLLRTKTLGSGNVLIYYQPLAQVFRERLRRSMEDGKQT